MHDNIGRNSTVMHSRGCNCRRINKEFSNHFGDRVNISMGDRPRDSSRDSPRGIRAYHRPGYMSRAVKINFDSSPKVRARVLMHRENPPTCHGDPPLPPFIEQVAAWNVERDAPLHP